jgi:hypothetical protein
VNGPLKIRRGGDIETETVVALTTVVVTACSGLFCDGPRPYPGVVGRTERHRAATINRTVRRNC